MVSAASSFSSPFDRPPLENDPLESPPLDQANPPPEPDADQERHRRINQRNARKSTGPRTPEGKARSSQNAITHGVFCAHPVTAGDDPQQFNQYWITLLRSLNPHDALELEYADQFINASWKLKRLQGAENIHLQTERTYHEKSCPPGTTNAAAVVTAILLRQWGNTPERFQMYERRLQNARDKALKELQRLKKNWPDESRSEFTQALIDEAEDENENFKNEPSPGESDASDGNGVSYVDERAAGGTVAPGDRSSDPHGDGVNDDSPLDSGS